ncbi:MAG: argininosuccinate synthase, partial [Candidatus Atribacteria bacterium]|nr:argininosuccinate synthase [Candidatus Atribacteria bacterium]
ARDLRGTNEKVIAVIGDAALGGGMAFEALNHAGHLNKDLLIILNDNELSITKSVGALSRYLNSIIANPIYNKIHQDLENLVMPREVSHFKPILDEKYTYLVYEGLWCSPLRDAIDAFMAKIAKRVSGTVRIKLYKGNIYITGRKSEHSLYDFALATYDKGDIFDQTASEGFIKLWGLPTKVDAISRRKSAD